MNISDIKTATIFAMQSALAKESSRTTVLELVVLEYIIKHDKCSIGDIGEKLFGDASSSSASTFVNKWEKRGIITVWRGFVENSKSERIKRTCITLSSYGKKVLEGVLPVELVKYK